MSCSPARTSRAMTLIEVLFALAILVVLSAGVGGFFFRMTDHQRQLDRLGDQQRGVAMLMDRLESSLLGAVAVTPDGSAGVLGDETSVTISTRGVQPGLDGASALSDLASTTFAFDERAGVCNQTIEAGHDSATEPVAPLIERMRFRYSDGRDWSNSFDSLEAGGLPVAVEVTVWLKPRREPPPPPDADDPLAGESPDAPVSSEDAFEQFDLELEDPAAAASQREPDHLRVICIPDAPAWEDRQP